MVGDALDGGLEWRESSMEETDEHDGEVESAILFVGRCNLY